MDPIKDANDRFAEIERQIAAERNRKTGFNWALAAMAILLGSFIVAAPMALSQPVTPTDQGVVAVVGSTGTFSGAVTASTVTASGTIQGNDVQVPTNRALYLNTERTIGFMQDGTSIRVLGALPFGPNTDQSINLGSAAKQWSNIHTGGLLVIGVQAVTGTDDGAGTNRAVTITPSSGNITLDCQDTNGCDVTMSETGAQSGATVCIVAIGAAGASNFADSAGVSELAGAFAAAVNDNICMRYITNRWVEISRSNN